MEAAYYRETGKQLLLSEQNFIDCAWDAGNTGCLGGFQALAYNWMADVLELATEEVKSDLIRMLCMSGYHLVTTVICILLAVLVLVLWSKTSQTQMLRVSDGWRRHIPIRE